MERASALIASEAWVGRDRQSKCVFVRECVYIHVPVCVCECKRGKEGGLGGYFVLRLISFWTHFFASAFVRLCMWSAGLTVVGMLVSSSLGYNMLSVCLSVCVCDLRVFLEPQDCRVPQVPQEIMVRGWVKAGLISQLVTDVSEKLCQLFSTHCEH